MTKEVARVVWGLRIPLRDGVELQGTLYLPPRPCGPLPVILTLTPYIASICHDQGRYFAENGFPFLAVDVRGRGNSDGEFIPNINEAQDGHDVVEWVARQSFCDGRVAMWGGSYGGYAQWAVAKEFPPHLAAIAPVASPCFGVDFPLRGNIFTPYVVQWLALVSGRTSQDKIFADAEFWRRRYRAWFEAGRPFREVDAFLGFPSPAFQEWLDHPKRGENWDRYNPTAEAYARMDLPILTITGAYDGDQPGALAHYREHTARAVGQAADRHFLVIGPWDHAGTRRPALEFCGLRVGPESLVDIPALHLDWYRWAMLGGPRPGFLQDRVSYYVMGADRWRHAPTLDAVTARYETLYLRSTRNPDDLYRAGALATDGPDGEGPDQFEHEPRDTSLAELESTIDSGDQTDQRMLHARTGRHLIYHTRPFDRAVEISGFFGLRLWLSIDQPDTDVAVEVHAVDPDGSSVRLSSDIVRARYRQNLRAEGFAPPGRVLPWDFTGFTFVSRRLPVGARLRLVIGPNHSIYVQRNFNGGGVVAEESAADARTVIVRLFHDADHPSALRVPIGHDEPRL